MHRQTSSRRPTCSRVSLSLPGIPARPFDPAPLARREGKRAALHPVRLAIPRAKGCQGARRPLPRRRAGRRGRRVRPIRHGGFGSWPRAHQLHRSTRRSSKSSRRTATSRITDRTRMLGPDNSLSALSDALIPNTGRPWRTEAGCSLSGIDREIGSRLVDGPPTTKATFRWPSRSRSGGFQGFCEPRALSAGIAGGGFEPATFGL